MLNKLKCCEFDNSKIQIIFFFVPNKLFIESFESNSIESNQNMILDIHFKQFFNRFETWPNFMMASPILHLIYLPCWSFDSRVLSTLYDDAKSTQIHCNVSMHVRAFVCVCVCLWFEWYFGRNTHTHSIYIFAQIIHWISESLTWFEIN